MTKTWMDSCRATRYEISAENSITIELRRGHAGDKWAIVQGQFNMSHKGKWVYEPRPSSRTDAFLKRCRFDSPEEAFNIYKGTCE